MPITYSRGEQPIWTLRDRNGDPLSNGWLWSYRDTQRDEFKAIYSDPGGKIAWDNPLQADAAGTLQNLYFSDDQPYYFEISKERNGLIPVDVIDTIEHYSPTGTGGGAPVTITQDIKNFVVNPQFTDHYPNKSGDQLFPDDHELTIAEGGWSFRKDGGLATDTLKFVPFPLGITVPPNNPSVYLEYNCTNGATGETYKEIAWKVPNVRLFAGEAIYCSFWAKSLQNTLLEVYVRQYFGSGGTPSPLADTPVYNAPVSGTWQRLGGNLVLPSVSGKTLGTDNDDTLEIVFKLPTNTISNLGLVNTQLETGTTPSDFERESRFEQNERRTGAVLPPIGELDTGKVLTVDRFYNPTGISPILGWQGGFIPVGGVIMWGTGQLTRVPAGWFFCDGALKYKFLYPLLFGSLFDDFDYGAQWGVKHELSFIGGPKFTNPTTAQTYLTATVGEPTIPAPANGTMPAGFLIAATIPGSPTVQQTCTITQVAGSLFNGGEYFTISSYVASDSDAQYYVWFRVDGVGIDPAVAGRNGIRCDISKLDADTDTAEKTRDVLENAVFKLPKVKDLFVRGWDAGPEHHPGFEEPEDIQPHNHPMRVHDYPPVPPNPSTRPAGRYLSETIDNVEIYNDTHNDNLLAADAIADSTGVETRPANIRFAYIIKADNIVEQ